LILTVKVKAIALTSAHLSYRQLSDLITSAVKEPQTHFVKSLGLLYQTLSTARGYLQLIKNARHQYLSIYAIEQP
jgi:hypothetical protein